MSEKRWLVIAFVSSALLAATVIYAGMNRFVITSGKDSKAVTYFDRWTAQICVEKPTHVTCKSVRRD